jgi:putative component of membrane protein insertase Oxa1/YidC/SpoIIIJ protein YidD
MRRLALAAIRLYQRHISPHKGFVCSFRVHTGKPSCSCYGYAVIERFGVLRGVALLRRRMRRCSDEYWKHAASPKTNPAMFRKQAGFVDCACDVPTPADCACDLPEFGDCACGVLDACDLPCDLGERRRRKKAAGTEADYMVDIPPSSGSVQPRK